jgi:hypothetical protein
LLVNRLAARKSCNDYSGQTTILGGEMKQKPKLHRYAFLSVVFAFALVAVYNGLMFACFSVFVRPHEIPIVNYPSRGADLLRMAMDMPRLDSLENKTAYAIKVSNLVLNRQGAKDLTGLMESAGESINVLDRFHTRHQKILDTEQKWALLSEQLLILNRLMFLSKEGFLRERALRAIQVMDDLAKHISDREDLAFFYLEKAVFLNLVNQGGADAYSNFELSNALVSKIDDSLRQSRLNTNKLYFSLSLCANGSEPGYPLTEVIDSVTHQRAGVLWLSARNFDAPLIGGLVHNKAKLSPACREGAEKLYAFVTTN